MFVSGKCDCQFPLWPGMSPFLLKIDGLFFTFLTKAIWLWFHVLKFWPQYIYGTLPLYYFVFVKYYLIPRGLGSKMFGRETNCILNFKTIQYLAGYGEVLFLLVLKVKNLEALCWLQFYLFSRWLWASQCTQLHPSMSVLSSWTEDIRRLL